MARCPQVVDNPKADKIFDNVAKIFEDERDLKSFLGTNHDEHWRARDAMLKKTGGPEMTLISTATIKSLGRIPRYDECLKQGWTKTYREVREMYPNPGSLIVIFFSHRWSRPNLNPALARPDDSDNGKAKCLVHQGEYRKKTYNVDTWWWIDWSCIDQDDCAPHAMMLPMYVACCNEIVCYATAGYFERGWTLVERAMYVAVCGPRLWFYYPPGEEPNNSRAAQWTPVTDPLDGHLTMEKDRKAVARLANQCKVIWAKNAPLNWGFPLDGNNNYEKWGVSKTLEYGKTKVVYWVMSNY